MTATVEVLEERRRERLSHNIAIAEQLGRLMREVGLVDELGDPLIVATVHHDGRIQWHARYVEQWVGRLEQLADRLEAIGGSS